MEDKDIQLITQRFDTLQSSMTTQFSGVNDRLDKINGRVGKTEDEIQKILVKESITRERQTQGLKELEELYTRVDEIDNKEKNHVNLCPVVVPLKEMDKRVRALEDSNLATISRKSFITSAIAMLAVILTITISTMKIIESTASANTNYLQKQNDSIIKNQQLLIKTIQNENTK